MATSTTTKKAGVPLKEDQIVILMSLLAIEYNSLIRTDNPLFDNYCRDLRLLHQKLRRARTELNYRRWGT